MMMNLVLIVAGLVFGLAMFGVGFLVRRRIAEGKLETAEKLAQKIVAEGRREAETFKKSAAIEAKEEWYKAKASFEKESQARQQELQAVERRIGERETYVDRKVELLTKKEHELDTREKDTTARERVIRAKDERLSKLIEEQNSRLERIAGMTQEEAKRFLLQNLESKARQEAAQLIKDIKDEARETAEREAKNVITLAVQRYASDHTAESTVSVVPLPNDEMKGRIIGREGRNIRSFEASTGVEVLIDDTPEAVIISGFDPIRREVARLAMDKLVSDGRIQPARIEEVVTKSREEVHRMIQEAGDDVCLELGISGLHPELVRLLGRLRFRTSYGQNVLQHSKEVAYLASLMASELELDPAVAKRAGLLHDLGKSVDHTVEGTHTQIGVELAEKYGESPVVVNAIASHHQDVEATSLIAVLVTAADAVSGARPGARRETFEAYIKRLTKLEEIASTCKGVEKSYAIQAGREIRIIVKPEELSDVQASEVAADIAKRIEAQLEYPGQIKVTVIRETRAVEYAK
jgi:ribonuclease Y